MDELKVNKKNSIFGIFIKSYQNINKTHKNSKSYRDSLNKRENKYSIKQSMLLVNTLAMPFRR